MICNRTGGPRSGARPFRWSIRVTARAADLLDDELALLLDRLNARMLARLEAERGCPAPRPSFSAFRAR